MGLGQALSEEFVVEGGVPVTETLKSLHIIPPTGMPEVECILVEEPQPEGPYGAKGVGEAALVPTAAAVAGALHAFDGIRRTRLPMKDSPAALAAVPHLVARTEGAEHDPHRRDRRHLTRSRARSSGTTSTCVDGRIAQRRAEASAATAPAASSSPATSAPTRTSTRRSRAACPTRSSRRTNFVQILQRVWWRLDRALDEESDPGLGARRRDGGAALRARRRSSTTTPRRTRSTARWT